MRNHIVDPYVQAERLCRSRLRRSASGSSRRRSPSRELLPPSRRQCLSRLAIPRDLHSRRDPKLLGRRRRQQEGRVRGEIPGADGSGQHVPAVLDDMTPPRQLLLGTASACASVVAGVVSWNTFVARADSPPATIASQFAALHESPLASAPASAMRELRSIHDWSYDRARTVGPHMYLAEHDGVLCELVVPGSGGCTDRLDPSRVWLFGDMTRRYDSETDPFDVHFYGFAVDGISSVDVTTSSATIRLPVRNNAFDTTLRDTTFQDISGLKAVRSSDQTVALDPRAYFPRVPPSP